MRNSRRSGTLSRADFASLPSLYATLSLCFYIIMLAYSEDGLTTASTAYCNGGHTSIRKCAYTFDILLSTNVPYIVLRVRPPSRKTSGRPPQSWPTPTPLVPPHISAGRGNSLPSCHKLGDFHHPCAPQHPLSSIMTSA
jgi:hypothetical protein